MKLWCYSNSGGANVRVRRSYIHKHKTDCHVERSAAESKRQQLLQLLFITSS
jgi:hypothetical protein